MEAVPFLSVLILLANFYLIHQNNKIKKQMALTKEEIAALGAQVDDLKATIETEHTQVTEAIGVLNQTIADLTAAVNSGATTEDLQVVVGKVTEAAAAIEGIYTPEG